MKQWMRLIVVLLCLTSASLSWNPTAEAQEAVARAVRHDPPIEQVRRAAARANGYAKADLDEWSTRARWSHLLPEVEGEVAWLDQRDLETRYREDLGTDTAGQMYRDSARNDFIDDSRLRTVYAIELQWDLSGLVYDRSEPTIAAEVRRRRLARQELLEAVGEAYYERRRHLMVLALTPQSQWRERLEIRLEVDRQTARLDAMTGGWFSRALQRRRGEER